jgi:chromosome segregation ATPase
MKLIKVNYFAPLEIQDTDVAELGKFLQALEKRIADLEAGAQQLVPAIAQEIQNLKDGFEAALAQIQAAGAEYDDDQEFGKFDAEYGEKFGDLPDRVKALNGPDYDIKREVYGLSKGQEDIAGFVETKIAELNAALKKAAGISEELKEVADGGISEEEEAIWPDEPVVEQEPVA